jgi:hypothetical protein
VDPPAAPARRVPPAWPAGEGFQARTEADRLVLAHSGKPVGEFVFRDARILRPYFANLHTPDGVPVTRTHPPVAGVDATDHDTMHPGLWLAFGSLGGVDFWRNQGRLEHARFAVPPSTPGPGRPLAFVTEHSLQAPDGRTLGWLTNRMELRARPGAWEIEWDATFWSGTEELVFGDQEEMGLGARVATALTEKNGGRITSSTGGTGARGTWGQPAAWCDYSGVVDGRPAGITLIPHPDNFRPSWWHNRDYGVFVANPFGRAAMKQGEPSRVTVRRGEPFRLRFTAVLHGRRAE